MNVNNRRPKMCTFIKRSYHKTHSDSKSFLILKLFVLGLEKYFEFDSTLNKFLSRQLLSRVMGNTNLEISFYKNTLTGSFVLVFDVHSIISIHNFSHYSLCNILCFHQHFNAVSNLL